MGRKRPIIVAFLLVHCLLYADEPLCGFWKIVDGRDGFTQTVVAVYEHKGVLYGRNIVNFDEDSGELIDTVYNPVLRVPRIEGSPFLTEINLFWGLEKSAGKWKNGMILDPRNGRVFACELRPLDDLLIIRGRWGPFYRELMLHRVAEGDFPEAFRPPDIQRFGPMIPKHR